MRKNTARIIAAIVAILIVLTAYSALTLPVYITKGAINYQQGYFGVSSQISNRTLVLTAFSSNETLEFSSLGIFVPYFKSSENSSLNGNYYLNLSGYLGHVVLAYGLSIGKKAENVPLPWTGITFVASNASMVSSDPFVKVPLQSTYPIISNGHPESSESSATLSDFNYPIQTNFPVNQTLQFWVNFTLTPYVELGPYYFPGSPIQVSITWNLTFVP